MAYKAAPLFAPITEDMAAATPIRLAAGRGGGRGRGPQVPLDRQERFDNLVFPRGGGPGSLAGRGGAPNAAEGGGVFRETCAQCHRYGTRRQGLRAGSHPRRRAPAAPRHPALDLLPATRRSIRSTRRPCWR